jgi:hypothetical protein
MDEKAKQVGRQSERREAAEGRLRQALVGLAKAGRAKECHAAASGSTEGRGTAGGQSAPSGQ